MRKKELSIITILFKDNITSSDIIFLNENYIKYSSLGLSGLIYKKFKSYPELFKKYKRDYYKQSAFNQKVLLTKKTIDNILKHNGIESYCFIKGADFLSTLYRDDIGVRPLSDIDIFIAVKQYKTIHNVLLNKGFKLLNTYEVNPAIEGYNSISLKYQNIIIELHWKLISDLFQKIIICDNYLNYGSFKYNFQVMYFIFLIYHSIKHHNKKLYWLIDIIKFVKKYDIKIDMIDNIEDLNPEIKKYIISILNFISTETKRPENLILSRLHREVFFIKCALRKKMFLKYTIYSIKKYLQYLVFRIRRVIKLD